jgi:hypothetical protein
VAGLALPELNAAANAAGNATRAVRGAAAASAAVQDAADAAAVATKGPSLRDLVRAPSQLSGVGAAETSQVAQRAGARAGPAGADPVHEGQLTRDRQQIAFERETAKQKEGAPLNAHYEDQNATFMQNLDAYAEQTGARTYSPRAVGKSVVSALEAKDAKQKGRDPRPVQPGARGRRNAARRSTSPRCLNGSRRTRARTSWRRSSARSKTS